MLFSTDQTAAPNTAQTPEELAFLHAVEFSDITSVRRLMAEDPMLNVDVIDALGRTALRLAVRNENRELIEILLEHCSSQNIQQAVLQAISEDHTSIAELMLRHPCYLEICRKIQRLGDTDGFFKTEVESQFSTDMTPLNLAAQKNNYAIVHLLLQRGETIPKPHKITCSCMECRNRMKFDQLRMANFRLNAYRGLSSEAYISLSSDDPFQTSFQLAKELRRLSDDEKHFKKEYKTLANRLSDYLVKLLDRVWTQQELSFVLDKKGPPDAEKYENLSRLKLALENKEKKFVAHPSVQQHLVKIWHSGIFNMDSYGWHVRLPALMALAIIYPFIVLAYFVKPDSKFSQMARQPMVKFLGHTLSFLTFLLILIITTVESSWRVSNKITLQSQYEYIATNYREYREELGEKEVPYGENFPLRPHQPTITEHLLTIWIAGMLVQELQQVMKNGVIGHFKDLFNLVDFCLLLGYIGTLVLFHWTMNMSRLAIADLENKNVTMMLRERSLTNKHLYWLNTDRMHWDKLDPTNVAEGMFAFANIISCSRVVNILPANESLGPMQISLGRMVRDFLKFILFTVIAMLAFIVALRNLYWWYSVDVAKPVEVEIEDEDAGTSFKDIISTFRTVFWWIYGRGAWDNALKVPAKYTKAGVVTEEIGQAMAALYHIAIIIGLVNLLIAMMARSFEKIVDDVDAEWKYARSLLYMEYISDGCIAPVPLNLLQPIRDVIAMTVKAVWRRCRKREEDDEDPPVMVSNVRRSACVNFGFINDSSKPALALNGHSNGHHVLADNAAPASNENQLTYKDITQTIVQRYIFDIQREEENYSDNLEGARENLFNTKWDLLELMEKRDNTVCHLTACLKAVSTELSNLNPYPSFANITRRRRWNGVSLGRVEEEDDVNMDKVLYPKTKIIMSGS